MTASEFGKSVTDRYKGATGTELGDIADCIAGLTDMGRGVLWRAFLDTYEFATVPKRAVFAKLIDKHDIAKVAKPINGSGYEYCCYVCGARFDLGSRLCPSCYNTDHNWIRVIQAGGYRGHKLMAEERADRELQFPGGNR